MLKCVENCGPRHPPKRVPWVRYLLLPKWHNKEILSRRGNQTHETSESGKEKINSCIFFSRFSNLPHRHDFTRAREFKLRKYIWVRYAMMHEDSTILESSMLLLLLLTLVLVVNADRLAGHEPDILRRNAWTTLTFSRLSGSCRKQLRCNFRAAVNCVI